jgi:hypothetical protein
VAACTEAGAAARAEVGGRWRTRRRRIGGVLEQIGESAGPWREAALQRPSHGERGREARVGGGGGSTCSGGWAAVAAVDRWRARADWAIGLGFHFHSLFSVSEC